MFAPVPAVEHVAFKGAALHAWRPAESERGGHPSSGSGGGGAVTQCDAAWHGDVEPGSVAER